MREFALNGSNLPLQDRDLLQRMTQYFDALEGRLELGEGWLIFNARPPRSSRIVQYIQQRLSEPRKMSHFVTPWRDFSLTSYMVEVELRSGAMQPEALPPSRKNEFEIATKVSQQTMVRMVTDDLLVVPGVSLRHQHEIRYLSATIEARFRSRLATIVLTPDAPHELESSVLRHAEQGVETWQSLSNRLYSSCLIAM